MQIAACRCGVVQDVPDIPVVNLCHFEVVFACSMFEDVLKAHELSSLM